MIEIIEECVKKLLYDDVLDNTFGVMNKLLGALREVAARSGSLSSEEKKRLVACLENLISESIREALHKGELSITNGVIRNKNIILRACGFVPDESHDEINPKNYAWSW